MNEKNCLRKTLVLAIIVLFVGASVIKTMEITVADNKSNYTLSSGNTLYVGGSGEGNYSSIQDAIDNASNGDTVFVYNDSSPYYEKIGVSKSIDLIGEDKNTTIIEGNNKINVIGIYGNFVNIYGFTIINGTIGITVNSNFNIISGNKILDNFGGIQLWNAYFNNITGNIISDNVDGIYIESASKNNILGNSFFNNGIRVYNTYHNNIKDNMINDKPLVYIEGESDYIINDAGQVILLNCTNIKTENLNLSNTRVGMELWNSNNCEINNTYCSNNEYGIHLIYSNNNIIKDCTISNNEVGIYIYFSNKNIIRANNIWNNDDGIGVAISKFNTILGNNINNNNEGIKTDGIFFSSIKNNNISNNDEGILLSSSGFNNIYKNNFLNNERDAFYRNSFINRWRRNYWNNSQIIPKLISGEIYLRFSSGFWSKEFHIPWITQFDWHPALKPYDI